MYAKSAHIIRERLSYPYYRTTLTRRLDKRSKAESRHASTKAETHCSGKMDDCPPLISMRRRRNDTPEQTRTVHEQFRTVPPRHHTNKMTRQTKHGRITARASTKAETHCSGKMDDCPPSNIQTKRNTHGKRRRKNDTLEQTRTVHEQFRTVTLRHHTNETT
ncbi:hypothetical protein CC80DRAFT_314642 [Byssothecium circinans]|uniref:Uncharacterized protein n=1 Tax=Byssothecium circinans TaxID=147558 RepID=A0A6A5T6E6_9PLEO|nr:hypothetical protein CC80DRAFT_314642 [Byssothecium circinans]